MDTDTSWCPVCDRQILPKRLLVPVLPQTAPPPPPPPPPSSPIRRTKGATLKQRSAGLVHGTGRVKPNGSIKLADSKSHSPPPPVKLRTVIDQGPTPLYCSDECQLADIHSQHDGLPIDYHPDRQAIYPSTASFSSTDTRSDSTSSSDDSQSSLPPYSSNPSHISPSLATLAAMYNFPPLPPPPPIEESILSSASESQPPEYTSGVMMAARRIAEYCPKPQMRDPLGHIIPPAEPPKAIAGWNDGSNGWRSSIYSFSSPHTQSAHDVKAYRTLTATSHRSRGVQSTFTASSSSRSATDIRSASSLPVESTDMITKFSQSFNRRSESRVSLYSPPQSSNPLPSTSPQKRERSLLQPGAEGKLLVPDVKMKVHSASSSSLSSAWSGPSSRRSNARSPLSVTSSSSDEEDGLTQRCESAMSLPQMKRPMAEGEFPLSSVTNIFIHKQLLARSWSYDNFRTYPAMCPPPKKEKRKEKRLVEGVETEVEVEVEVQQPLKRLFLFPASTQA